MKSVIKCVPSSTLTMSCALCFTATSRGVPCGPKMLHQRCPRVACRVVSCRWSCRGENEEEGARGERMYLTAAPRSRSLRTVSTWPELTAMWRAVSPCLWRGRSWAEDDRRGEAESRRRSASPPPSPSRWCTSCTAEKKRWSRLKLFSASSISSIHLFIIIIS